MSLAVLIVPYEVDRDDTPMARAPEEMIARGFDKKLRRRGFGLGCRRIRVRSGGGKLETVASLAREIAKRVAIAREERRFPVILSGSCMSALGVVTGLRQPGRRASVLWIDAHGDFNDEESSPSGYWDGMSLAALCGRSLPALRELARTVEVPGYRVAHLGGRNLDPPEIEAFREAGVLCLGPHTLTRGAGVEQLKRRVLTARDFYLHIDLDGLDPHDAPAVAFPEMGGVRLEGLKRALQVLPPPAAVTFSAMSFATAGPAKVLRTIGVCVEILETLIPD